jgi:hypothetical protein
MSRKNNLNPDYYKTAGRGRQGDGIEQGMHKQQFAEEEARRAYEKEEENGSFDYEGEHEEHEQEERGTGARDSAPLGKPHGQPQRRKKGQGAKRPQQSKKPQRARKG